MLNPLQRQSRLVFALFGFWFFSFDGLLGTFSLPTTVEGIGWATSKESIEQPVLDNLYISHGNLDFKPDIMQYDIPLSSHFGTLEVVPAFDPKKYTNRMHPKIQIAIGSGRKQTVVPGIGASLDITPYSGSAFDVVVKLTQPGNSAFTQYKLMFNEDKAEPRTNLLSLTATDNDGDMLKVTDDYHLSRGRHKYVYALQKTHTVTLKGVCEDGSTFMVNGSSSVTVKKDKTDASQLVTIECQRYFRGKTYSQTYFLSVLTDLPAIPPPSKLVVLECGKVCLASDSEPVEFYCESDSSKASFLAAVDPLIKYTIVNADESVKVRLLSGEPTAPIPCSSGLYIQGTSGHPENTKVWPLRINGVFFPAGGNRIMQAIGWAVGVLLILSVLTLIFVLGMSNAFGLGSPFGTSEVPSTLIFLLQYFCFANVIRGAPTVLSDTTSVLKWVTLWWPLPWKWNGDVSVSHVDNAAGCLFWCLVLLLGCLIVHFGFWLKHRLFESAYTYPHAMLFGNWESRVVHFLAFPATAASMMLLTSSHSTSGERTLGAFVLASLVIWTYVTFVIVKRAVKSRSVVWVWAQSLRENNDQGLECGYWSDSQCDQLQTEPANRSIFVSLFPWTWASAVASIEPVCITSDSDMAGMTAGNSAGSAGTTIDDYDADDSVLIGGPAIRNQLTSPSSSVDLPMGKTPRAVEVCKTCHPTKCSWSSQRLVTGLLRSKWLDILFTYDSLTRLYSYSQDFETKLRLPLTIKTHQLLGPLSGGSLCFFFDGVRIPFVRSGELLFRVCIGLLLGVVLCFPQDWLAGICFFLMTVLAFGSFAYSLRGRPFTRSAENWLLCAMISTVGLSAFSFTGLSFAGKPNPLLDIFLWFMAVVCVCLSMYSVFITFCILSAVMCPPMEEFRFLERLCNCDVVLSDHMEGFKAEAMGYSRYGTRNIMVQCTYNKNKDLEVKQFASSEDPVIELPAGDVISFGHSRQLAMPKVCMSITSNTDPLGYKHVNLYDRLNLRSRISQFVGADTPSVELNKLLDSLVRQIETRSHETAVLSLTIALPASLEKSSVWAQSRGISLPACETFETAKSVDNESGHVMYGGESGRKGYSLVSGGDASRRSGPESTGTLSATRYSQLELRSRRNY